MEGEAKKRQMNIFTVWRRVIETVEEILERNFLKI